MGVRNFGTWKFVMFVRYHAAQHDPFTRWHKVARTYDVPVDQEGTIGQLHYSACGLYFYGHDNNVVSEVPTGDERCTLNVCNGSTN